VSLCPKCSASMHATSLHVDATRIYLHDKRPPLTMAETTLNADHDTTKRPTTKRSVHYTAARHGSRTTKRPLTTRTQPRCLRLLPTLSRTRALTSNARRRNIRLLTSRAGTRNIRPLASDDRTRMTKKARVMLGSRDPSQNATNDCASTV
jgi:hypothetical protein